MEAAPLTKAYIHAKAASDARKLPDSTVAINEHALAAGEFSNATKSTNSIEALRVLKLLEEHHRKLSSLLQLAAEHPVKEDPGDANDQDAEKGSLIADVNTATEKASIKEPHRDARSANSIVEAESRAGVSSPVAVGSPSQQRRYPPARELSSSIASNLASARGIRASRYRGQALTPSVSNEQAPGVLEANPRSEDGRSRRRSVSGKPSWVPPPPVTGESKTTAQPSVSSPTEESAGDDGYSRFYGAFGSIINRLSAPLAFAGLPLISEESGIDDQAYPSSIIPVSQQNQQSQQPSPPVRRVASPTTVRATDEPDLSKIYSRAALQAVMRGGPSANESFYVVPSSGLTVSYANILNFDQKEKRRLAASLHGGDAKDLDIDQDFIDARQATPHVGSGSGGFFGGGTVLDRKSIHASRSARERELTNTVEELRTQNVSLKDMLDKVSKRLHTFEASAQHSRMALADSMRLVRPGSPLSSNGSGIVSVAPAALEHRDQNAKEETVMTLKRRLQLLEEDVAAGQKREAQMQKSLDKYKAMWEKLKKGARARREGKGSSVDDPEGPG